MNNSISSSVTASTPPLGANSFLHIIHCPLCESHQSLPILISEKDHHIHKYGQIYGARKFSSWVICDPCGFVYQNPRPTSEALNRFYLESNYHDGIEWEVARFKTFSDWYYGDKIEYIQKKTGIKNGKVFDIGFGHGGALHVFAKAGWQTYGVESDQKLYKFSKDHFQFTWTQNDILDSKIKIPEKVDVVFSNHAFEHFADLSEVMAGIQKILKPGGFIFTCVPTYAKNRSRLSLQWLNSAHYNMFTHQSLNQLFARHQLKEQNHTYRGFWKEIDEVWHLAALTNATVNPKDFYENPRAVSREIHFWNPLRSLLFAPFFTSWPARVRLCQRLARAANLAVSNPSVLFKKLRQKMKLKGSP